MNQVIGLIWLNNFEKLVGNCSRCIKEVEIAKDDVPRACVDCTI